MPQARNDGSNSCPGSGWEGGGDQGRHLKELLLSLVWAAWFLLVRGEKRGEENYKSEQRERGEGDRGGERGEVWRGEESS